MKLKRFLSLFAAVAVIASAVTIPVIADSSEESASLVLFSDDFDSGYESGTLTKHTSDNNYTNLTGNDFKVCKTIGIKNDSEYFFETKMEKPGQADNTFVLKNESGVGSGRALNVTTQAGLGSTSWIIKNSGISKENIENKELSFTLDFMVPEDNGFNKGNGILVYLDKLGDSYNMPTTRWSFGKGMDWAYKKYINVQTLFGIEAEQEKNVPSVFAFGEKLMDIEIGKAYNYKLVLAPNGMGGYTAKTEINGVVTELNGANLPTVDTMADYQFAMVAEKANPSIIASSYTGEDGEKYQNDKTIALLDNLCLSADTPAPESDMLFEEYFSNYAEEYIQKASKNEISVYNTNAFTLRYDVSSGAWSDKDPTLIPKSEHPENVAKLVDGIFGTGSGKSLQLTSQGIVTKGSMYKLSNITETKISEKALVFNTKFMIPSDGVYNGGVGFAVGLSPSNTEGTAPDAVCTSRDFQISQDFLKNKYKLLAAQGMELYVFGEKQWDLEKDVIYNYSLKLYPNGDGTYKAAATLNGDEIEITSANIPTAEELKDYKYAFAALHNHGWLTYAGSLTDGVSNYTSDKPLVYIDDITLERKNPSEVEMPKPDTAPTDEELGAYGLFDEDFEDYKIDYVKKAAKDELSQYEKNSFVLNYNAKTAEPAAAAHKDGRIETGNVSNLGKISKDGAFGNGSNYLSIQSQGLVTGGTMWKRSNITPARINNKTLVFKAKFKIPSDSQWDNGMGAAVAFTDADSDATRPNGSISSVNMFADDSSSKYYLTSIVYRDGYNKFKVFGENVADVEKGKEYDVTVTMVPDSEGKYKVTAKLNDTVKVLEGKKTTEGVETDTIPTMSEFGTYNFAAIISHANSWNTGASFTAEEPYKADRDIIFFDDISLKRADNFVLDTKEGENGISDLTTEGKIDMAKKYITLNLKETIASADESKITIDNGAEVKSVEICSVDSSGKQLRITFDKLKLNAEYKISVDGVVNPIGVKYAQTFTLSTSSGIDVDYNNITLTDGIDGKKKVTVPVAKADGVTETIKPAVIVCVYDGSVEEAPLVKKSYAKEDEVTDQTSIEITGIDVETGDKVRVFVWDGLSTMRPLTQRKDLQ